MKKLVKPTKLSVKKVTLRDLDKPVLNAIAGGISSSCSTKSVYNCLC